MSLRTVRRGLADAPVAHGDDQVERRSRRSGPPRRAAPFTEELRAWLAREEDNGLDAIATTCAHLIDELPFPRREGELREALATCVRPHIRVVDEVGDRAGGDDAARVLHPVGDGHGGGAMDSRCGLSPTG